MLGVNPFISGFISSLLAGISESAMVAISFSILLAGLQDHGTDIRSRLSIFFSSTQVWWRRLSKLQQEGHSSKELEAQLQTNLAQAKGHKVEAVSLSAFQPG